MTLDTFLKFAYYILLSLLALISYFLMIKKVMEYSIEETCKYIKENYEIKRKDGVCLKDDIW